MRIVNLSVPATLLRFFLWSFAPSLKPSLPFLIRPHLSSTLACERRCAKARASGCRKGLEDLLEWLDAARTSHDVLSFEAFAEACRQLLIQREQAGGDSTAAHAAAIPQTLSEPTRDPSTDDEEGEWDAADSAFTDEDFRAGCYLFTQFYRGLIASHPPLV